MANTTDIAGIEAASKAVPKKSIPSRVNTNTLEGIAAASGFSSTPASTGGNTKSGGDAKTITNHKDNGDGTYTITYSDGTSETFGTKTATGGTVAKPTTDTKQADAYQRLYDEFNALGLGSLVSDAKNLLMNATSISAMPDALRGTKAYMTRFSANDDRIKAGLAALSPAEYLAKEDAYQSLMRNYGLPASYYTVGANGKQEGFDKLIASDVSAVELENRIATAQQRVLNSNPEVLSALKQFYPDISNADILAYALDPKNGLDAINRKVTAAEIGGAALQQGLKANGGTAESLAGQGITKAQAQAGYADVADMTPRGSQLADIYNQGPYNQSTAEAEVFNTAGAAEARAKRKKLTSLETAQFSGSSGVGALGKDRQNPYGTTQSGYGQY